MIYAIYKPIGMSSNGVLNALKRLHDWKKIGHAGTLDPLAEGLLLVLTNESTQLMERIHMLSKTYYFEARYDGASPTLDSE
jgi:tRNA pseudouridine55 synthase